MNTNAGTIQLDWNAYIAKARETVAEGCVLLKNDNQVLPFAGGTRVSVFGRMQNHYYKSGVGSGGMVNVDNVVGILEGIKNNGSIIINEALHDIYNKWELENPYDEGCGWGHEPWSQPEMPLSHEVAEQAAKESDVALVIIARTAGEDRDSGDTPGSYRLTDIEEDMLNRVREHFRKVVVLVNSGSIIDMSFVDSCKPDAVVMAWQGGMVGGDGVADILTGKATPSGKLVDTVPFSLEDYPATRCFGDRQRNYYCEDIYVGYRYFETFAREKVRYPFGYGLSYTTFDVQMEGSTYEKMKCTLSFKVKNTGAYPGKEVVQIYGEAPQGQLGKPARVLLAFAKTGLLKPGEEELLTFEVSAEELAGYDDSGVTGHKSCYVLEAGTYRLYAGTDVRNAEFVLDFTIDGLTVTRELTEAYAPVVPYERLKPISKQEDEYGNAYSESYEPVPLSNTSRKCESAVPEIKAEGVNQGDYRFRLDDVLNGKATMEQFVAQLTDYDLACIASGEGMGSMLVTPGTAAAFGGVSGKLRELMVPAVCCSDGPSGIRMDCGTKAFSLPNGTLLGCTFNTELVEELYTYTGIELAANNIECLLGPGINIHRHPLNGRNFEYFSEDPVVTGQMAVAQLKALKKSGVTGVLKHFCGNNQELERRNADTVISERAMREIYLKAFEMGVKVAKADAIMTTYGVVNGIRTACSYDLCTKILRQEWGFKGIVMTDWWTKICNGAEISAEDGYKLMLDAQNDIYMVTNDGSDNPYIDKTLELLEQGLIQRGVLQRSAYNVCYFAMNTLAMKRMLKTADTYEILGRPEEENQDDIASMEYIPMEDYLEYALDYKESKKGTNYIIPVDVAKAGIYEITLTGRSSMGELAQIPCSIFAMGTPAGTFTFNGTGGKSVSITRDAICFGHKLYFRIYVGANGVELEKIEFRLKREGLPTDL